MRTTQENLIDLSPRTCLPTGLRLAGGPDRQGIRIGKSVRAGIILPIIHRAP